jgi:hypothetical protein
MGVGKRLPKKEIDVAKSAGIHETKSRAQIALDTLQRMLDTALENNDIQQLVRVRLELSWTIKRLRLKGKTI